MVFKSSSGHVQDTCGFLYQMMNRYPKMKTKIDNCAVNASKDKLSECQQQVIIPASDSGRKLATLLFALLSLRYIA
jgi:hypothetical protein